MVCISLSIELANKRAGKVIRVRFQLPAVTRPPGQPGAIRAPHYRNRLKFPIPTAFSSIAVFRLTIQRKRLSIQWTLSATVGFLPVRWGFCAAAAQEAQPDFVWRGNVDGVVVLRLHGDKLEVQSQVGGPV